MIIFKNEAEISRFLLEKTKEGKTIGFIPTMGALHNGHLSLVETAQLANDFTVVSIFVNPTQFNDIKDFELYPVTESEDIAKLLHANCDVLFLPPVKEIYPNGLEQVESIDFNPIDTILEGAFRPGHFKGVGQVVKRLLQIVRPHKLYIGQKDFQQCVVIRQLLKITPELNHISLQICSTQREADGLAMSSRNVRLTQSQRIVAASIYQCLVSIQSKINISPFSIVQKECLDLLKQKGFEPEYVNLALAENLTLLDEYDSTKKMVALIAAKIGNVRLIDNLILN